MAEIGGLRVNPGLRLVRAFAALAFCLIAIVSWTQRAHAQTITVDPATAFEAAGSSFTANHTVSSGSNRYILVSVAIERNDATVASVTYAGQALNFLGRLTDGGGGATLDLWGRTAPASGTNQLVVSLSNSAAVVVGAKSFANVDQTNPLSGTIFSGNGTVASGSITTSTNQLMVATLAVNDEADAVTAGAGQTSLYNVINAADVIGAASTKPASASSTSMSYSFVRTGRWVLAVIALQPANPFLVTNTNDSGGGSLREAINAANASPAADTISFEIPGAGPHTITLSSLLPAMSGANDAIDGTTQTGSSCGDLWAGTPPTLQIHLTGALSTALQIAAANQTVRGLSITGFDSKIYVAPTGSDAIIRCNYFGLLPSGTRGTGDSPGVVVQGPGTVVGGLAAGEGNVISGNTIGVFTLDGATDTAVRGNFIGTDPTGTSAIANVQGINHFTGSGSWRDITYNLISGNSARGIGLETDDTITASTDTIRIQRNVIGFNRTLSALLPNSDDGIFFDSGSISNVLIGGDAASEGNDISGGNDAIDLRAVSNINIRGNTIARAGSRGVWLEGASNIAIGSATAGEGNAIGGNGAEGIFIGGAATGVTILGNEILPLTIAGSTTGNAGNGIGINGATNITIGDGTSLGRNVIAGNGGLAIGLASTNTGITINGNYIGVDASGNLALANGQNRDALSRDAIEFGQGSTNNTVVIANNVIGGYTAALIEFYNSTTTDVTVQGNSLGVGADGSTPIVSGNSEALISSGGGTISSSLLIGGNGAGLGNTLAFSSQSAIRLDATGSGIQVIGNTIRDNIRNGIEVLGTTNAAILANSIYDNGLLGIDLGNDGVTENDAGDADAGANALLNFPVINAIAANGTSEIIYDFNLDAPANTDGYRVEFFRNSSPDTSGNGEGEEFIGSLDISHAGGDLNFNGVMSANTTISANDQISATASRNTGSGFDITSEFADTIAALTRGALTVTISSQVYDPGLAGLYSVPQNDRLTTATVTNEVGTSTTNDSIFLIIDVPADTEFYNGDVDGTGPETNAVAFDGSNAPGLTFTYATDVRFSDAGTRPDFASCTYTPAAGYDPNVRFICINPKGTMPQGDPPPSFVAQFRQRIK